MSTSLNYILIIKLLIMHFFQNNKCINYNTVKFLVNIIDTVPVLDNNKIISRYFKDLTIDLTKFIVLLSLCCRVLFLCFIRVY